jgi:hypothetical protein
MRLPDAGSARRHDVTLIRQKVAVDEITNQGLVNWRTCQPKVLNLLDQQQRFYPYQTAKNHIRRRLTGRLPGAGGPLLSVTYTRRPVVRRCSLDSWNCFKIAIYANSINWCARLRKRLLMSLLMSANSGHDSRLRDHGASGQTSQHLLSPIKKFADRYHFSVIFNYVSNICRY